MLDVLFDDLKISDYGICLTERPVIPVAVREVKHYDGIDSRDGSLTEFGGFKDRLFKLDCNLLEDMPIKPLIRRFRGALLSKRLPKLVLTDDPEFYYIVKDIKMGNVENEYHLKGSFTIAVTLDPFDYSKNKVVKEKDPGNANVINVVNGGTYHALPIITVAGTGEITIRTNNNYPITLSDMNGKVVIDCEAKHYYDPERDSGRNVKLYTKKFPVLEPGANKLQASGNVTEFKVEFKERWL